MSTYTFMQLFYQARIKVDKNQRSIKKKKLKTTTTRKQNRKRKRKRKLNKEAKPKSISFKLQETECNSAVEPSVCLASTLDLQNIEGEQPVYIRHPPSGGGELCKRKSRRTGYAQQSFLLFYFFVNSHYPSFFKIFFYLERRFIQHSPENTTHTAGVPMYIAVF